MPYGQLNDYEENMVQKIADLLHVTLIDFIKTKFKSMVDKISLLGLANV